MADTAPDARLRSYVLELLVGPDVVPGKIYPSWGRVWRGPADERPEP